MNRRYLALIGRIEEELSELEIIVERTQEGWKRAQQADDDLYLDSVALNLHGFYAGLERIFELIATNIDETKPSGKSWHQELLKQMMVNIKQVRPPVISRETVNALDEYRGFRHVVRNVYTFNLSMKRLEPLVDNLPDLFERIRIEINEFIQFMEQKDEEEN